MKRRIACILAAVILLLSCVVCTAETESGQRVFDESGLFTEDQIKQLESLIAQTREKYNVDIAIVAVDTTNGQSMSYFASSFFDTHSFGVGADKDGLELTLKMTGGVGNRDYYVDGHGALGRRIERSFDDESFLKYLRNNDYFDGACAFVHEVARNAENKVSAFLTAFIIANTIVYIFMKNGGMLK